MPSPAVAAILERLDVGAIVNVAEEFKTLTSAEMRELAEILVERANEAMQRDAIVRLMKRQREGDE